MILNSQSPFYDIMKNYLNTNYQDNFWFEDSIFLERNSRDLIPRVFQANHNAEILFDFLLNHPKVEKIYYPKCTDTDIYLKYRKPNSEIYSDRIYHNSRFGSVISFLLKPEFDTQKMYDFLELSKGPSLGTNFTLCCPYTILAHFDEFEFAEKYGVDRRLIRISVGLEDVHDLVSRFTEALNKA
jgi:cystathionine gamma-synthase